MYSVKLPTCSTEVCTLDMLRQEAEACITKGVLNQAQTIAMLSDHLPRREWDSFVLVLEEHGFLLQDRLLDLLPQNTWQND